MIEPIFKSIGRKGLHYLAKKALLEKHYMKCLPTVTFGFCGWEKDSMVAVCTFGIPASRHLQKSLCPSSPDSVLELNRLWIDDRMPRNTASSFLSRVLASMEPHLIVSYADTRQGHLGHVYRAANFFYAGWTDMERVTARFDYVPPVREADELVLFPSGPKQKHTRDAFRSGEFVRIRRKPKVKYWTVTGTPTEKRRLKKISGWPALDWKIQPPPTEHVKAA